MFHIPSKFVSSTLIRDTHTKTHAHSDTQKDKTNNIKSDKKTEHFFILQLRNANCSRLFRRIQCNCRLVF